jgi:hypothetical protein
MKSTVDTYDNNGYRTLNNKTPNQIFTDNDDQMARHLNDSVHNQLVKTVPFDTGDLVRILERKRKMIKDKKNSAKNCIPPIKGRI